jgi:hypothetical protein
MAHDFAGDAHEVVENLLDGIGGLAGLFALAERFDNVMGDFDGFAVCHCFRFPGSCL